MVWFSYSPLACVSSRPWLWQPLVYRPILYQSSFREIRVASVDHSCDQGLVGEPLPCRTIYEAVQPQQSVPRDVSIIEAERKLVNVPPKMLWGDMMIGAVHAALQDGQTLSMPFVETSSRTNSPALWLRVSCSNDCPKGTKAWKRLRYGVQVVLSA